MANIGTLAAKLTMDDSSFNAVVDRSIKKMGALKDAVAGVAAPIAGALSNAFSNFGTILEGNIGKGVNGLLDQLKGAVPGVHALSGAIATIPGVGVAAAAGLEAIASSLTFLKDIGLGVIQSFVEAAERGMARIRDMGRLARTLGVSLSSAAGFQMLGASSGMDQGQFLHGMGHLRREIDRGRRGDLGSMLLFQEVGVSAQMLEQGNTAEIFNRIADSVAHSNDTFRNARLMRGFFGRGGEEMNAILRRGSAGLTEAEVRAQRFGAAVTSAELGAVGAANAARQRMVADWTALFQGLENRAGVALAPLWESIADSFDKAVNLAQPTFAGLRTAIDAIGVALKSFSEGFSAGLDRWAPQIDLAMRTFEEIGRIVSMILVGSDGVAADWSQLGDFAAANFAFALQSAAGFVLDIASGGVQIYQVFYGLVGTIDSVVNGLRDAYVNARQFALVMAQSVDPTGRLAEIIRRMPATIGQRSELQSGLRDMNDVIQAINAARAGLNGPLRSRQQIAVDQTIRSAADAARAAAERGAGVPGVGAGGPGITAAMIQAAMNRVTMAPPAPGALALGTAAAVNAINAHQREEGGDPIDRMAMDVARQLEEQRAQTDLQRRLLDRLRDMGIEVQGD